MGSVFKRQFKANLRTFTDRESFKRLLTGAVETPQAYDEHRIRMIYGVGGQGKTYLKDRFLVEELLRSKAGESPRLIYSDSIDFEKIPATRSAETALLAIARDLIEQGNLPLPAFCLAFLKYQHMTSLSRNLQEQYPYLFALRGRHFVNGETANEVLNEVVDLAVSSGLSEAAASIPMVGFLLKKAATAGKNRFVQWIQESDAKEILADLDGMNRTELLEKLPMFLGYDVYKALERDAMSGRPARRIVIIIDGYETIWSSNPNLVFKADAWVRTLTTYMTGALFVFFGREALRWAEIEKNQALLDGVEQFEIRGFADEDAHSYLLAVPIVEDDIRNAIVQNSKAGAEGEGCLPIYLRLEAQTYENIVNTGRTPRSADFAEGNEQTDNEIVTRFFGHLDPSVRPTIEALCLPNYIDDDIIEVMESHNAFPSASISLKALNEYSFVDSVGAKTTINGIVRDIGASKYKTDYPPRFTRVHTALFEHFDRKTRFEHFQELTPDIDDALRNAGYHKLQYDRDGFAAWIMSRAAPLYGSTRSDDTVRTLLHQALEILLPAGTLDLTAITAAEKQPLGRIFYLLAERYLTVYDVENAERFILLAVRTYETICTDQVIEELHKQLEDGALPPQSAELIEQYTAVLEKAAEICAEADRNVQAGEYFHKVSNLSTKFGLAYDKNAFMKHLMLLGRYVEAESFFFARYKKASQPAEAFGPNVESDDPAVKSERTGVLYTGMNAAMDLASIFRLQGRYQEAKLYGRRALDILLDVAGENHEHTATAKRGLARTLILEGSELPYAERLLNEGFENYKVTYGANSLTMAYVHVDYFYLKRESDPEAALEYHHGAMNIIANKSRGLNARAVELSIETCKMVQRHEARIGESVLLKRMSENHVVELFRDRFEQVKNLYGIYHPVLHEGMDLAARIMTANGNVHDAHVMSRRAAEFRRILAQRTEIRVRIFDYHHIVDAEKRAVADSFRAVTSLPDDIAALNIERVKLPFYSRHDLYRITFLNTLQPVVKYVLSDGVSAFDVDSTNEPIYKLGETELVLDDESVIPYATFFYDCISGPSGKFRLLHDHTDIPWMVDVDFPDGFKEAFKDVIAPVSILERRDDRYVLSAMILFNQSVFRANLHVMKQSGLMAVTDDRLLTFYEDADRRLCAVEDWSAADGSIPEGAMHFTDLAACVDPTYEITPAPEEPASFEGRLLAALKGVRRDLELLYPTLDDNDEDAAEFQQFQTAFVAVEQDILGGREVNLAVIREILTYNHNFNVDVHNVWVTHFGNHDRRVGFLRDKLRTSRELLDEISERFKR